MLLRYALVGLFGCKSAELLMLLPGPAVPLPDVWGWPVSLGLEEFPLVGKLVLLAGLGSVSLTPSSLLSIPPMLLRPPLQDNTNSYTGEGLLVNSGFF